jgi:hypothetical protein
MVAWDKDCGLNVVLDEDEIEILGNGSNHKISQTPAGKTGYLRKNPEPRDPRFRIFLRFKSVRVP